MLSVPPADSVEVVNVAEPLLIVPVPIGVVPCLNVTVSPLVDAGRGVPSEVTASPYVDGFSEDDSVVVVSGTPVAWDTARGNVVVLATEPDTPVIVTVAFPRVAVGVAVNVSVVLVVAGVGEKAAVTPVGKPDAEGVTLPLKPF